MTASLTPTAPRSNETLVDETLSNDALAQVSGGVSPLEDPEGYIGEGGVLFGAEDGAEAGATLGPAGVVAGAAIGAAIGWVASNF